MIEENVVIYRVDTKEPVQNVADLRNNVTLLKAALNQLEIGSKEYQDTLKQLTVNQNALKDAMHGSSASMEDIAKAANGASQSYNGLVHQMAKLKEELRNVDVSTESGKQRFKELAAEINQVNGRLKSMDAMQGNFSRNVGNYANSVVDAFGQMGGSIARAASSTKPLIAAFNVLKAHPVIAVLGVLVAVLQKVVAAVKSSEDATNKMNVALSGFRAIGDVVTNVLQKLAGGLADVVGWFGKLAAKITGTEDKMEELQAISQKEIELQKQQRETLKANAEAERDVAELRAKAADKLKYSAQERIGFLQQAGELEKQIAERAYQDAKKAYEVQKAKNAQTQSDAAALDKETQAYAAMLQAETNYNNQMRSINAAIAKATKEIQAETAKAKDGVIDLEKVIQELNDSLDVPEVDLSEFEKGLQEQNRLANLAANNRLKSMDKAAKHQLELNNILTADEEAKAQKAYEIQKGANERRLIALQDFAQSALDRGDMTAYLDYSQQAADLSVEIETNALREKARLRKQDEENAKKSAETQKAIMQSTFSAVSSIFGSLAEIYEADGEANAKAAAKAKNLKIASTTIDTISGAVAAYMNAVKAIPDPILGPSIGALQAAAVAASGYANIRKIKATDVSGNSSSTTTVSAPAVVTPPAITEGVQQTSATGQNAEDTVNAVPESQPVQVYILDSEIQAHAKSTATRVQESTF